MVNLDDAYKNALEYLYSFVDFSMQKVDTYSPARFKLERMVALVDSLGNPQKAFPSIHVAGTKGKGSVSALCASALLEAGYTVGLYTSPHLDDYAERIQVDGEFITHADLVEMVEEIKPHVAGIPELTTFEITTALAFMYFAKRKVTAAVIEVGLGGRLDATNVIVPEVSVITSISYDHTYLLGDTLTEIACEKSGIIKTGIPVVSSPQVEEARVVIEKIAKDRSCQLILVGRDILYEEITHSLEGQTFRVWSPEKSGETSVILSIPLLGPHQLDNAVTAYAILDVFSQKEVKITQNDILRGFKKVFWPGRFEIVQLLPPVILDCAHNRDSAYKLRLTLEEFFPGKRIILIFGASEDKDIQGMFIELMPLVKEMLFVKSFHPRAIEPTKLVDMVQPFGHPYQIIEQIPEALEKATKIADDNLVVLVTGSIFVVAEARKYLEKKVNIRRY
jgi:dihydrofolate synthase / folylpolyglutamate synthase